MDLDKMKALALAATKGPWIHDAEDNIIYPAHGGRMIDICCRSTDLGTMQRDNNAAFVAGCNPATVLELIAEVERLRADAERYRTLRDLMHSAKGGASLTVNQELAYYETPEPGEEVCFQFYPDTPVGFYSFNGTTLDEMTDAVVEQFGVHTKAGKEPADVSTNDELSK